MKKNAFSSVWVATNMLNFFFSNYKLKEEKPIPQNRRRENEWTGRQADLLAQKINTDGQIVNAARERAHTHTQLVVGEGNFACKQNRADIPHRWACIYFVLHPEDSRHNTQSREEQFLCLWPHRWVYIKPRMRLAATAATPTSPSVRKRCRRFRKLWPRDPERSSLHTRVWPASIKMSPKSETRGTSQVHRPWCLFERGWVRGKTGGKKQIR